MRKKDRIEMVELRTKILELERTIAVKDTIIDGQKVELKSAHDRIDKARAALSTNYGGGGAPGQVLVVG